MHLSSKIAALLPLIWLCLLSNVQANRPNIVLILMDDMGYNDIGAQTYPSLSDYYPNSGPTPLPNYSDPDIPPPNQARQLTPAIDSIATDGLRMTQFYASPKCSPSRGSMLAGRYDARISINSVFNPASTNGFNTTEVTFPEILRQEGYATGMVGKWHLGYNRDMHNRFQMMPMRHGFQEFLGTPHSNDMSDYDLIRNDTVEIANFNSANEQAEITWRYTEAALDFIQRSTANDQPFFLYLAHTMTHQPCWPSDRTFTNADGSIWPKFLGSSGVSNYYDVVKETDHSVGRVLEKLNDLGIAENTIVIFTSDNGPWLKLSNINTTDRSVGSAYPLKDGKFTTWEGGCRVPFLIRWPGHIPANTVSKQVAGLVDILPTFVSIAGGEVPTDRTIDGIDLSGLWTAAPGWTSPRSAYPLFEGTGALKTIIKGDWKLRSGKLYNLATDIQETVNLAASEPATLADLQAEMASISGSISSETSPRGVFTNYEVQLSANDLQVIEGSTATVDLKLSANPGKVVIVTVSHFSGDNDLSVLSGASLSFDSANWNAPQTVTIAAAQDLDFKHSGATFQVTTDDITHVRELFAFEVDAESPPPVTTELEWPKVNSVITTNTSVKLTAEGNVLVDASQNPTGSTFQWLKVFGPGEVIFSHPNASKTGVRFETNGTYQLRFTANHPNAGGFDTAEFTVEVGTTQAPYKYAPILAYDASTGIDQDSIWDNMISPGTHDWSLAANVTRTFTDPAPKLFFIDAAWSFTGGPFPSGGSSDNYEAYGNGNASLEFWFKPTSLPTSTKQVLWETGGDVGASFILDGNLLRFVVDSDSSNVANGAIAEGTLSPSSSQDGFVHCVGVIDLSNDQIKLYIDGSLTDTVAIAGVSDWAGSSHSGLATIAHSNGDETDQTGHLGGNDLLSGNFEPFTGMIAYYLFYDQALTTFEITDLVSGPRGQGAALNTNVAPIVTAGNDQSVAYTAGATLTGTASDDNLPASGSLTTVWSLSDGPADLTFVDSNARSTIANFSLPGTHEIWLEADDGEVRVYDEILVTVASYTYNEWANEIIFPASEDSPADNPDGDPWSNGWEWLLGSNPLSYDSNLSYNSTLTTNENATVSFSFEFIVPRNREPSLSLQATESLSSDWNDLDSIVPSVEVIDTQMERWKFELLVDSVLKTQYFIRPKLSL